MMFPTISSSYTEITSLSMTCSLFSTFTKYIWSIINIERIFFYLDFGRQKINSYMGNRKLENIQQRIIG